MYVTVVWLIKYVVNTVFILNISLSDKYLAGHRKKYPLVFSFNQI